MTVALVVCTAVLAMAVLVFVAWREKFRHMMATAHQLTEAEPPKGIARLWRQTVVVTLKTGPAFSGVLWEEGPREIVLRSANGLGMAEKGDNLPVDGELLIYVADIAYMQKP